MALLQAHGELSKASLTDAEIAWCAGLIEGEGTFYISKTDTNMRIMLGMTDIDVIERLQNLLGGGISYGEDRGINKPIYRWYIGKRLEVVRIIKLIYPYMGARRRLKMDELLQHHINNPLKQAVRTNTGHGTISYYTNKNCRCKLCGEAWSEYGRKKRTDAVIVAQEKAREWEQPFLF